MMLSLYAAVPLAAPVVCFWALMLSMLVPLLRTYAE
jgi:hypothetical protein